MLKYKFTIYALIILTFCFEIVDAQNFVNFNVNSLDNPSPGYILTGPINGSYLTIYDNSGQVAYSKDFTSLGHNFNALRILTNGNLAFFSINDSRWYIVNDELNVVDNIAVTSPYGTNFHTFYMNNEGHYLLVANESKNVDMSQKIQKGSKNALVYNELIQEFDENKNLVFEWNCYDHIDVLDATEDIDVTSGMIDPYHINSVVWDNDGNLLANFRNLDEVIKINRTTGDIIWIMGGSKSKKNQFTFINDTKDNFSGFSHQHDPHRLPNGNIILFDNGNLKPNRYSRAIEYQISPANKTATKVWEYAHPSGIFAAAQGNAQRLPNGNTMIGWGTNDTTRFNLIATEVTSDGNTAFEISQSGMTSFYQVLRKIFIENAVQFNITSSGSFDFSDGNNQTNLILNLNSMTGTGYTSVEKHNYSPYNISFASTEGCRCLPYRWVINSHDISNVNGRIYINLSTLSNVNQKAGLKIFWRAKENSGPFTPLETTYNQQFDRLEADINSFGEFVLFYDKLLPVTLNFPLNQSNYIPLNTTLKWNPNPDASYYNVQICLSDKFDNIILDTTGITLNELNHNFLLNFSKYYWRVKAIRNTCESEWSNTFSFTTVIGVPNLFYPLDLSVEQQLSGNLKWNAVYGADLYKIQVDDNLSFIKPVISQFSDYFGWFNYSNLKPMTKYYWRVTAGNNGHFGDWSNIWSFTTSIGKVYLEQPENQSKGISVNGTLKWDTLPGTINYRIQLAKSPDFNTDKVIDTFYNNKNELIFRNLDNSTIYYWRARGYFKDTMSNWSDIWQFKTMPGKPKLNLPKDSAINSGLAGYLYWFPDAGAKNYEAQISSDIKFKKTVFDQFSYNETIFYMNLSYFTRYFWRVRINDGESFGEWSDIRTFRTHSDDTLLSPLLFYPKNDVYNIPVDSVVLYWIMAYGATGYELRVAQDSSFVKDYHIYNDITTFNDTIFNLDYNTTYFWNVRAKSSKLMSPWGDIYKFTTILKEPVTTNFKDDVFSWEPVKGAMYYHLNISLDSTFKDSTLIIKQDSITDTKFKYSGLKQDTTYFWRVSATNEKKFSDWSLIAKFKTPKITSVEEKFSDNISMNIYPIPVNSLSKIKILVNNTGLVNLEIIDIYGRHIKQIVKRQLSSGEYYFDLLSDEFSAGTYFCIFSCNADRTIQKFQIIK